MKHLSDVFKAFMQNFEYEMIDVVDTKEVNLWMKCAVVSGSCSAFLYLQAQFLLVMQKCRQALMEKNA